MEVSVSLTEGTGSTEHNQRGNATVSVNVHEERSDQNVYLKTEKPRQAYERIFGAEVRKYNEGKDPSRQIQDYYRKMQTTKKGVGAYREIVVMLGDKDNHPDQEDAVAIYTDFLKRFEEKFPQFDVFNASIHLDEATPHMHLDYIPIAHGAKRGLETRMAFNASLKQMHHNFKTFRKASVELMEEAMKPYGYERKDMGNHEKHKDTQTFKKDKDRQKAKDKREKQTAEDNQKAEAKLSALKMAVDDLPPLKAPVVVQKGFRKGQYEPESVQAYVEAVQPRLEALEQAVALSEGTTRENKRLRRVINDLEDLDHVQDVKEVQEVEKKLQYAQKDLQVYAEANGRMLNDAWQDNERLVRQNGEQMEKSFRQAKQLRDLPQLKERAERADRLEAENEELLDQVEALTDERDQLQAELKEEKQRYSLFQKAVNYAFGLLARCWKNPEAALKRAEKIADVLEEHDLLTDGLKEGLKQGFGWKEPELVKAKDDYEMEM